MKCMLNESMNVFITLVYIACQHVCYVTNVHFVIEKNNSLRLDIFFLNQFPNTLSKVGLCANFFCGIINLYHLICKNLIINSVFKINHKGFKFFIFQTAPKSGRS